MARPVKFNAEAVREKAMHTFWRLGYAASTVEVLSAEIGLGKGSFYNTFGSKKQLYLASLDHYAKREVTAAMSLLAKPGTAPDRIARWLTSIIDRVAHQQDRRGCLLCNASVDQAGLDNVVAERVRLHFEPLTRMLDDLVVCTDDLAGARQHAHQLMAVYVGLQVLARGGYSVEILHQIVTQTVAQVPG